MSAWTVPALAECAPQIEPVEFCALVRMAEKPEATTGGIILPTATRDKEQWGASHARLVALSPLAMTYAAWPDGARKPQVGDIVFTGKFPGEEVTGRDGHTYRLISDKEILAVIERAETAQLNEVQDRAA